MKGPGRKARSKSKPAPKRPAPKTNPRRKESRTVDYQRLFDLAPDAIIVMDDEGHYIHANAAACRLTGYTLAELTTMRVGDLTVPSDRADARRRFNSLRNAARVEGDFHFRRKDQTKMWVEIHAVSLGDGTYAMCFRNVSQRVTAQQELKRSLGAYGTLVDLCHAAVISAGRDGLIRSWNPAAETLFGFPVAEAVGMPLARLIPARMLREHLAAFERRAASDSDKPFVRSLSVEALRKDGVEVPVEVSVAVGGPPADPIFTAVVRDMTEYRAVVEKLNDALQRLRFHMERMPLAYIVWDVNFRVVEWNRAAEQIFGYSKAEAVGKHAYELVVPPEAIEAVDKVWADLLQGDTSSHSANANVRKDGSRLTCDWINTPLRDSAGQIRGVASMARDVTEREAMEARIRDAQKLESLGVLAGGVAHDFNSSLMVILGNAALLRSIKEIPLRAAEHIELIEEAGSRANQLIKHLLAYARTGRHNPQPTDLNALIRGRVETWRGGVGWA